MIIPFHTTFDFYIIIVLASKNALGEYLYFYSWKSLYKGWNDLFFRCLIEGICKTIWIWYFFVLGEGRGKFNCYFSFLIVVELLRFSISSSPSPLPAPPLNLFLFNELFSVSLIIFSLFKTPIFGFDLQTLQKDMQWKGKLRRQETFFQRQ